MKTTENGSAQELLLSQNNPQSAPNNAADPDNSILLYHKCLDCPDYGVTCNGPKLAALGDIMVVRAFHRAIRGKRSIPMKMIYLAAQPVSESTINDYFSHSVKDFKWTTVGCIDNALTAICGNRVGQPLLDHPCPASSSEIQNRTALHTAELDALRAENHDLQQRLAQAKGKVIATREEVKEDYASRVQFLKDLCEKRQSDIDELKRQAADTESRHRAELARMDAVAADYLSRIDEKNKRIDKLNNLLRLLAIFLAISLIALSCYIVWDLAHRTVGFFRW